MDRRTKGSTQGLSGTLPFFLNVPRHVLLQKICLLGLVPLVHVVLLFPLVFLPLLVLLAPLVLLVLMVLLALMVLMVLLVLLGILVLLVLLVLLLPVAPLPFEPSAGLTGCKGEGAGPRGRKHPSPPRRLVQTRRLFLL